MQATESLAVPTLRYSFGIIKWHQEEIQKLDRKTRKMLTIHGQHHPRADIDRLYVPRKGGERGLMQVKLVDIEQSYRWLKFGDIKYNCGSSGSGNQHKLL
jgi:hypothetical protein